MGGDKLKNLKHGAIQRDFLEFLREGLILRKSTSKTLSSLRYFEHNYDSEQRGSQFRILFTFFTILPQ